MNIIANHAFLGYRTLYREDKANMPTASFHRQQRRIVEASKSILPLIPQYLYTASAFNIFI